MRGSTNAQPSVPITNRTWTVSQTVSAGHNISETEIWTCPEAGTYTVEILAESSGSSPNSYYLIGLSTSTGQARWLQESTNAEGYVRIGGTGTLTMATGEVVRIRLYTPGTGWPSLSFIATIIRLA